MENQPATRKNEIRPNKLTTMRVLVLLISFLFLQSSVLTQIDYKYILPNNNPEELIKGLKKNKTLNSIIENGELWVNDTIRYFDSNFYQEWTKDELFIVLTRNLCGKITTAVKEKYNSSDELEHYEIDSFYYYDNGIMKESLTRYWDDDLNEYSDTSEYVLFDKNGNQIYYYSSGDFFDNKGISVYNENNQLIEHSSYNKSKDTTGWTPFLKYTIDYNELGNQINFKSSSWNEEIDDWEVYAIFEYIYDTSNFLIEINGKYWDEEKEEWKIHSHQEFKNDNEGNMIERLYQIWNDEESKFVNNSLYYFTYDDNNNNTSYEVKIWESDSVGWVSDANYIFVFNDNNDMIKSIDQKWDVDSLKWITTELVETEYDIHYNKISETVYFDPFLVKKLQKKTKEIYSWHKLSVPEPVTIQDNPVSVEKCKNEAVEFSVNAIGDNIAYQWYKDGEVLGDGDAKIFVIDKVDLSDVGDYYCIVSGSCNSVNSEVAHLSVAESTNIINQPQDVEICENGSVTFSIEIDGGEDVSYQWIKDGENISGANKKDFLIDNISISDAGSYQCIVTDKCGITTSNEGMLTVNENIIIVNQPNSLASHSGSQIEFSVDATGSISSYQWYKDNTLLNDGNRITGTTTNKLSISNIALEDKGEYLVKLSGVCGDKSSEIATLDVTTSVLDLESAGISISPNPASTMLNILNTGKEIISLKIYDGFGQMVLMKLKEFEKIDVSFLPEGIYFIEVKQISETSIGKVIVKK